MTTPILATKLYIPSPRSKIVPRPRLIEKLNTCLSCRFILVSAPAGFGKSTVLSEWVRQVTENTRVAWLSLDESDNDLTRFLVYIVAAIQTINPDFGKSILTILQSSGELNLEFTLTTLINEISEFSDNITLILDDYHVIETQQIDQAIAFLLDHMPPQMHLVIASRIDPTLPLSRLRARGELIEVRAKISVLHWRRPLLFSTRH